MGYKNEKQLIKDQKGKSETSKEEKTGQEKPIVSKV